MSERLSKLLVSARWLLLLVAVVAAVVAQRQSTRVAYDRSIENMFAAGDPLLKPYRKLKRLFGGNEVVLAVYVDPQLMDPEGSGLRRLTKVGAQMKRVPGVRDVLSLAEVNRTLEVIGKLSSPLGPWRGPALLNPDSALARRYLELFEGYTHGQDGQTAALVCLLESEETTDLSRRETVRALRGIVQQLPDNLSSGLVVGEPVMVVDGFLYVEQDGRRLGWATALLLAATIIVCFRSLRWVLIPVAVVQLTLLLTRAVLAWAGLRLSMVSSMLTAIVTVVGVATVVHVIVRYRDARLRDLPPRDALIQTGTILMVPVFWACVTDAVGFASLTVAQVGPVNDFGIMMAIGSLLVLVSVVLLIPPFALIGRFDTDPHRAWGERRLDLALDRLMGWVQHRPRLLALVLGALLVLAASGVYWLEVETDFTRNFRRSSPIVSSYAFVEENLGGAGVWDVLLAAPPRLDREYLDRVRRFENRIRGIESPQAEGGTRPGLTKVISLADAVAAAEADPLLKLASPEMRARAMAQAMPNFVAALRSTTPDDSGQHYLRVMLRSREGQAAEEKQRLIDEVTRIAQQEFSTRDKPQGAEVTGFFVLLTNLIKSIIRDQWICFAVATAGIGLMMMIAFRSPLLALVALVPNAFPILMVLGLLGWSGLKMNMGAAMIAAVSMGLSVDSSIHFITSFQRARRRGKSVIQCLHEVEHTVGRALVFSTLALIVGFSVLCISQFVPTIYFGVLVSLSMLGGLVGNLLVLPLLLMLIHRRELA